MKINKSLYLATLCLLAFSFAAWRVIPDSVALKSPAPSAETMLAAKYASHGGPQVIKLDEQYPRPTPLAGQILVRVAAASINPVDFKLRRNVGAWLVVPKPNIPGTDIAGIVEWAPPGSHFKVGDRVAAMMPILGERWGASAQFSAVSERFVARVPDNLSLQDAASLPLVALTVMQAFEHLGESGLRGKKVLIHAGAGGVGTFALQYAKLLGAAEVVTTVSREKENLCKDLGADVAVDYRTEAFEDRAAGVDVILDTMSYKYESRSLAVLSRKGAKGHYLNILSSDWQLSRSGSELSNGLTTAGNLITSFLPGSATDRPRYSLIAVVPNGLQLQTVLDHAAAGRIRPVIDRIFPLAEAAAAHQYLENGHASGKVVLEIPSLSGK